MPFVLNRRDFLRYSLAAAVLPHVAHASEDNGLQRLFLEAQSITAHSVKGQNIRGFGFGDTLSSLFQENGFDETRSIMRLQTGKNTSITIKNSLRFSFRLHFIGLRNNPSQNTPLIEPQKTAAFTILPPDSGTFMYQAADEADRFIPGFCGMVIVNEENDHDAMIMLNHAPVNFLPLPHFATPDGGSALPSERWTVAKTFLPERKASSQNFIRLRFANSSLDRIAAIRVQGAESLQIIAIDGQSCPAFPPFENRLALTPHGRMDALLEIKNQDVEIVDEHSPDKPLLMIPFSQDASLAKEPDLPESNPLITGPIPLENAVRATWDLSDADATSLFSARKNDSIALNIHNPENVPFAFHLEGHSARLLDTLDDGWKPWWHDSLYIPPQDTVRIVFRAGDAGQYKIWAQKMNGEALPPPLIRSFTITPA